MSEPMQSPFVLLGGAERARAIAATFYDIMDRDEPRLAKLHTLDDEGRVHPSAREKFALFFVGWLGGPQDYVARHGHPRLRMRHMHVPIDMEMRDAWLRAMSRALDEHGVEGTLRSFLDAKLRDLADHMRNIHG
ncbi:MAG: group II truncated hemoglobin [Deltaproteobacteria bacterium]